jgi:hypothetical protein
LTIDNDKGFIDYKFKVISIMERKTARQAKNKTKAAEKETEGEAKLDKKTQKKLDRLETLGKLEKGTQQADEGKS